MSAFYNIYEYFRCFLYGKYYQRMFGHYNACAVALQAGFKNQALKQKSNIRFEHRASHLNDPQVFDAIGSGFVLRWFKKKIAEGKKQI